MSTETVSNDILQAYFNNELTISQIATNTKKHPVEVYKSILDYCLVNNLEKPKYFSNALYEDSVIKPGKHSPSYPNELKDYIVNKVLDENIPIRTLAYDYNLSVQVIYNWVDQKSHLTGIDRKQLNTRFYSEDYKRDIVKRVLVDGERVVHLLAEVKCTPNTIYNWISQYRDDILNTPEQDSDQESNTAIPEESQVSSQDAKQTEERLINYLQDEINRLRSENQRLKQVIVLLTNK